MKGLATPKKQTTKSKTGKRRSHLLRKLQRAVNRRSPVKVGKMAPSKKATQPAAKQAAPKKKSSVKQPQASKKTKTTKSGSSRSAAPTKKTKK